MPVTLSSLALFLLLGVPVAFAIGLSAFLYLFATDAPAATMSSFLFSSLNSAALMSIPFFILSAEILARCGATRDLVAMVMKIAGNDRGALPVVAVLSCMFFSLVSGSSTATAAAIGTVMIPELIRQGYNQRFALGLIATSGGLAMLIPPSVPLIIYGLVTETSVRALFQAAMLPGLALGMLLCVVGYVVGRRMPARQTADTSPSTMEGASPRRAIAVLLMPVIVLGGIYTGFFTLTESAAVAAVYSLCVAVFVYGTGWRFLLQVLGGAAGTASIILMILGAAALLGYVFTSERVPHLVFNWVIGLDIGPGVLLFALAGCLLVAGMLLEVISVILIVMPILLPLLHGMDISTVSFAILLIINMELAVITPPIGLNLFVISSITGAKVHDVFMGTLPFAVALLGFLCLAIVMVLLL